MNTLLALNSIVSDDERFIGNNYLNQVSVLIAICFKSVMPRVQRFYFSIR